MSENGPVKIQPVGRVDVATRAWRYRGQIHVSAIAKATFGFTPGGPMSIIEPAPIHDNDLKSSQNRAVVIAPADTVPLLPRTDVTLVGSAYAGRAGSQRVRVRFAISRPRPGSEDPTEGPFLFDKSLDVFGPRTMTGGWANPQPALFTRMPLGYDRALGGPDHPSNPAGTGTHPDARGRLQLPNIQHPPNTAMPVEPAGFGPIPMSWPVRARLFPNLEGTLGQPWFDLPPHVDLAHFHAAPFDQRIDFLRGNEWIVLERLHPRLDTFATGLPNVRGVARVYTRSGEEHALQLRADALWVDADNERCTVTFRGSFPVPNEDSIKLLAIAAGYETDAAPAVWPVIDWPRTLVIDVGTRPLQQTLVIEPEERTNEAAPATMVLSSSMVRGGTLVLESEALVSTDPRPLETNGAMHDSVTEDVVVRLGGEAADSALPFDATLPKPVSAPAPPAARPSGFITNVASLVEDWEDEEGYEATLLATAPPRPTAARPNVPSAGPMSRQPESTERAKSPSQKKRERGG
ncbi:MAG: DUF2169 domain-containing protein [Polyangiaceae bacterium]